ncbi:MAG: DUF3592 domain-containing protein [Pirellulaceae bacterium]
MKKRQPTLSITTTRPALRGSKLFLGCFFSLFLLFGSVLFVVFAGLPFYRVSASRSWSQEDCKILSSRVESYRGDDGIVYSVEIEFEYEFGGQKYTSDRYSFSAASSSNEGPKQETVRAYPAGSRRVCYVNPKKPSFAVLNRETTSDMYFGLFTLIFVIVGGGGIIGVLVWKPKPPGEADWLPDQDGVASSTTAAPTSPTVLKPTSRPVVQFFVILGITLFWCGIVSVFTYQEVIGFQKGRPEWFVTIFMIPFQLIGLLLLCGTLYSFLAMFNPIPIVEVNTTQLALGDRLEVKWSFQGRTSSIRKLKVILVGEEQSQYRRGTSTYTDTSAFFQQDLTDVNSAIDVASGATSIDVPVTSMHSFDGGNNKIAWSLRIHGEIARWPDVDTSFPLVVHPVFLR